MATNEDGDDEGEGAQTVPERSPKFLLEFFIDESGRRVVRDWLRSLTLTKKQVLGTAMREVLQELGLDVCGSEFGRQLGQGLFEFRLRQKAGDVRRSKGKGRRLPPESILLRVFCHAYGDRVVLLLGAYDKGEDPSPKRQAREIETARSRLKQWKARRKAEGLVS